MQRSTSILMLSEEMFGRSDSSMVFSGWVTKAASSSRVNFGRPLATYRVPLLKSPASWATSVSARLKAFCGSGVVPAVQTISLLAGKVAGS